VNCVSPGLIETVREGASPAHHQTTVNALGRRGTPEEVAAAVCYLCGPGARYVTGQTTARERRRMDGMMVPGPQGFASR
jgi:3-oxoacyl-[acyl-carrier protein] reductase